MNSLRKFAVVVCAGLLAVGLLGVAWAYIGNQTVRNEETVKGWIDEAGVYDNVVEAITESVDEKIETDSKAGNLIINKAISTVFTPDLIQKTAEGVVDSVYLWLNTEDSNLSVVIDLNQQKNEFIRIVGELAAERASSLPTCSASQTQNSSINNFDPLEATCLPAGVTAQSVKELAQNQIDDSFLKNTTLTDEDFKIGEENTPFALSQDSKNIKRAYEISAYLIWIFVALSLVSGLAVLLLSSRKLRGIRRIGSVFVGSGIFLGISWLFSLAGERINESVVTVEGRNMAVSNIIAGIIREVSEDISRLLIWFVIGYLIIGVILIVVTIMKNRQQKLVQDSEPEPPIDDSSTEISSEATTQTEKS